MAYLIMGRWMGQYVNLGRKEVRNDEHTGREAFIEPRTGTHTDKER
jgi:hypothetical protein